MTRRPIRVLPEELAQKIAAGEVVERPASVVKELLDNAIDAGATRVRVEVREAGLKLIRVTDNGGGIPREELPLAFTSHATSKITRLDELETLTSLGFRGEALPSIAAVARVEVQTRAAEETAGTRFCIEHGAVLDHVACSSPLGTRVAVMDLFANVPARRKFVKSLRAEGNQIAQVVMQYAMAQPSVQFTLQVDGRTTFVGPGSGRLEDAVSAVYGGEVLPHLVEVGHEEEGVRVQGLASTPKLTRQNRSAVHIIVNGRPVQNRSLAFALEEAYSGFLMTGRHPLAVIHLWLPPGEVDVNIHPAKAEVRFAADRLVHGALHRAVGTALLQQRLEARSFDLMGTVAASEMGAISQAEEPASLPLDTDGTQATPLFERLPMLRVFGQAGATFIIAEGPDGLYMIDQHAAHERILFDRFDAATANGPATVQPLLEPVSVELTPVQMQALDENRMLLRELGFELEPFGDGACLVRALPSLARDRPSELVTEVLTELEHLTEPAAARERALAALACRAAVKAGQLLDLAAMRELVEQLERTARPATCPHGRPTMIHLSHSQLEKEFGRR